MANAADLFPMSDEERKLFELRLAVSRAIGIARKRLKLTQAQAAEQLRVSQPRYSNIELGLNGVSLDVMVKTLFALGGKLPTRIPCPRQMPAKASTRRAAASATSKSRASKLPMPAK